MAFDLQKLKRHPETATPEDVLELIRLLELAHKALPSYSESPAPDGRIGDIQPMPRQ